MCIHVHDEKNERKEGSAAVHRHHRLEKGKEEDGEKEKGTIDSIQALRDKQRGRERIKTEARQE